MKLEKLEKSEVSEKNHYIKNRYEVVRSRNMVGCNMQAWGQYCIVDTHKENYNIIGNAVDCSWCYNDMKIRCSELNKI
jgi:hypothetical protein